MAKIAILGYGTVGSGVAEVFRTNQSIISVKAGENIEVKYVLDLRDFPGDPLANAVVHDFSVIEQDPEVSVVVETMGGVNPALDFSRRALKAGKSVCTSNKELVAEHGEELMALAKENHVNYLFEASCGGAIPIIRPLNSSITCDEVEEFTGIMNGTTNYILTKMTKEGRDFAEVLKEAQDMGYAEKNPTADVEGYDTCRKLAILSSLAFGMHVSYKEIETEGISNIDVTDIRYAGLLGLKIKLVGYSVRLSGGIAAIVCPMLIGGDTPLYQVDDVFNAILIKGNMIGESMFYGKGAGKLPTGSAVASDVVDCVRNKDKYIMIADKDESLKVLPKAVMKNRFLVRAGKELTKEAVGKAFGQVSFLTLDGVEETAFTTEVMTEEAFAAALANAGSIVKFIRIKA